jgi:acetyl-CoA acyltransferase
MPESVLVSAVRTPVGRAPKGALSTTRPDDLAALAIIGALAKIPALDKSEIEDVILGCAQPEGEQGWDMARWAALRAGLPVEVPGVTVNRLCSSGLEAIALANLRIRSGEDRVVIAGGAETMSLLPFGGLKPSPNPYLAEHYPASLLTMGLTAERVARHYSISREDQDAFALASHQKAIAAQAAGRFTDELIPVTVTTAVPGKKAGKPVVTESLFSADEGPRADTSAAALAKLKPAFRCAGIGDRRQLLADLRRSRRGGADGFSARAGVGHPADWPHGDLCRYRLPAGGDGHGPGDRDSQGVEEGGPDD